MSTTESLYEELLEGERLKNALSRAAMEKDLDRRNWEFYLFQQQQIQARFEKGIDDAMSDFYSQLQGRL